MVYTPFLIEAVAKVGYRVIEYAIHIPAIPCGDTGLSRGENDGIMAADGSIG